MSHKAVFYCSRFARAGEATDFNLVKNQPHGHAKKFNVVQLQARLRAQKQTENTLIRHLKQKLQNDCNGIRPIIWLLEAPLESLQLDHSHNSE